MYYTSQMRGEITRKYGTNFNAEIFDTRASMFRDFSTILIAKNTELSARVSGSR